MDEAIISISGVEETVEMLKRAPKQIVASAFVKALDAAGEVVVRELWPRVPIDLKAAMNKAHAGKGPLVGRLDKWVELDSQLRGGSVDIGFGDLWHIALWYEYGHRTTGHKASKSPRMTWKQHVQSTEKVTPASHMMSNACEASAQKAIDVFSETLSISLKEGIPGVPTGAGE